MGKRQKIEVRIDYAGRPNGTEMYSWSLDGHQETLTRDEITKKLKGAYHRATLDFGDRINENNIAHFRRVAYS